jgi:hypothetical protein
VHSVRRDDAGEGVEGDFDVVVRTWVIFHHTAD